MEKPLKSILIVDDDEVSNMITTLTLNAHHVTQEVHTVLNGVAAIDYLKTQRGNFPQLILLDINMPLMNGMEFLEYWQQNNLTGSAKISMYTTSIRHEDKEQAFQYEDVIAYIEKPLSKDKIDNILRVLQLKETYRS
ncbi:Response regulator receiver domain-containing protein [Catalinimonas alkaloidigena]|uniref:Response regulator receiver domain-containing protein n=1 Tax=Catalinimonas alkaloidigena TaxID=1075417 RepID=A0A1G9RKW6_9BACT|nr:response regulator [Catalinimonas alkaloidigena]SDM23557.1 Response regulator receiver domain-containing protein [Catalinimonas alkaloidigena]